MSTKGILLSQFIRKPKPPSLKYFPALHVFASLEWISRSSNSLIIENTGKNAQGYKKKMIDPAIPVSIEIETTQTVKKHYSVTVMAVLTHVVTSC